MILLRIERKEGLRNEPDLLQSSIPPVYILNHLASAALDHIVRHVSESFSGSSGFEVSSSGF